MIIKIQRSADSRSILVYNEDKSVMYQCGIDKSIGKYIKSAISGGFVDYGIGDSVKFYCNAHMEGTIVVFDDVIELQDW